MADFLQRLHACARDTLEHLMIPSNLRQLEEEFYGLLIETLRLARGPEVHALCPNRRKAHVGLVTNMGRTGNQKGEGRAKVQRVISAQTTTLAINTGKGH